jgi:hypothetical protein
MGELKIEAEPGEVGLGPGRLQRIDRHFARCCTARAARPGNWTARGCSARARSAT